MNQPEGIILAFSSLKDNNLKHQNPELQKIRDVLKEAEEKGFINIIEHNGVTYNSLSYLLNSGKGRQVTMLHFSGHSSKNGLWVQSQNEHGIISKKPLTNLIKAHKKFRFVFLNSCYSKDIAQELVDAGVPYVIGTTDRVNDEQSAIVAAKFYSLLGKWGKTIEESFLLTKDYIDDPLNDNDTNIKEAFRTFDLLDDSNTEYPWQLFQSSAVKDQDKSWVLRPGQDIKKKKLFKTSIATAGIILTLLIIFFSLYRPGKNDITNKKQDPDTSSRSSAGQAVSSNVADQSNRIRKANTNASPQVDKQAKAPENKFDNPSVPIETNAKHEAVKTSAKKLFAQLKVSDPDHQYNYAITASVREIFVGKGYLFAEAGAESEPGSYDNLVSGGITLSQPVKTNGPFNTVIVEYTIRLKLMFSDGPGKQICGQREYSAKVSTGESDSKEKVLQQGLNDVLDQLQSEINFPFCVKK